MLDPVIGILIVACLTVLFASAAIHKLRDPAKFRAAFSAYAVLPPGVAPGAAAIIPLLELCVALGLLAPRTRAIAGSVGIVLLLGYAAGMAVNLRRGRRDIACGCGGPDERRPIAAWMAWRNLALALLLALALGSWQGRTLLATDALTVCGGLAAAVLLYQCLDRLGQVALRARALQVPPAHGPP